MVSSIVTLVVLIVGGNDMMRSKAKLLQEIANEFFKTSQVQAPNITTDEARQKLKDMDTQDLLDRVEQTIISDLALKNVQPQDIFFQQFAVVTPDGGSPYLSYKLQISPEMTKQIQVAVARNKATHPNFMLSNYVRAVIQRLNPGVPARGVVQSG